MNKDQKLHAEARHVKKILDIGLPAPTNLVDVIDSNPYLRFAISMSTARGALAEIGRTVETPAIAITQVRETVSEIEDLSHMADAILEGTIAPVLGKNNGKVNTDAIMDCGMFATNEYDAEQQEQYERIEDILDDPKFQKLLNDPNMREKLNNLADFMADTLEQFTRGNDE